MGSSAGQLGERGFGKLNRSLRPPAALLLASRGLRKRPFRATISFYFLGLDIALLAVLALHGLADAGWRAGTHSAVPHGSHPRWQGVRD